MKNLLFVALIVLSFYKVNSQQYHQVYRPSSKSAIPSDIKNGVVITGRYAFMSASNSSAMSGGVYVLRLDENDSWKLAGKLQNSTNDLNGEFPSKASDSLLLINTGRNEKLDPFTGLSYFRGYDIYSLNNKGNWIYSEQLNAGIYPDFLSQSRSHFSHDLSNFHYCMSTVNEEVAFDDELLDSVGLKVSVFRIINNKLKLDTILPNPDNNLYANFGLTVGLSGNLLAITSIEKKTIASGTVYVPTVHFYSYDTPNGKWKYHSNQSFGSSYYSNRYGGLDDFQNLVLEDSILIITKMSSWSINSPGNGQTSSFKSDNSGNWKLTNETSFSSREELFFGSQMTVAEGVFSARSQSQKNGSDNRIQIYDANNLSSVSSYSQ